MAIARPGRACRITAVALVALLLSAVVPWAALAQTGDYSGAASGSVAEVQLPGPGGGPPIDALFAESTGAVNSQAGIIPDVPSSQGDESQDFAVGTASPMRGTFGAQRNSLGSVQSSAPDSASGSFDLVGPGGSGTGLATGHAETASEAAPDGSTAQTDNATSFTDGRFDFHLPLHMPTGSSQATVERAADGTVTATGHAQLGGGPGQRVSAFGGYVTAAGIEALSTSTANGAASDNLLDFRIDDLQLGVPNATPYVTVNADPGPGNMILLDVTIAVPGGATVTDTITIPRGSELLSALSTTGTTLPPAFSALNSLYLGPLIGSGGPLDHLQIILAAGYSDDGDGSYARGLIEAVQMSIVVGAATVAHGFGRAYSAADAQRAFSTATDPALPPGTAPSSDAASAFPESRAASPAQLAFASDAGDAGEPGEPGNSQPPQPAGDAPASPEPVDPGERPISVSPEEPADQARPSDRPAEEPVAAVATTDSVETLPFTGLDVSVIIGLGLLLLVFGGLGRWATRKPAACDARPAYARP
jgi:hypothetical protein